MGYEALAPPGQAPPLGYWFPDRRTAIRLSLRKFRFLELPGEIRNRIYELLFDDSEVLVQGTHPQKELQLARQVREKSVKPQYHLYSLVVGASLSEKVRGGQHSWMSVELLRTCRSVNREAVPFLYGRQTFRFQSMTALTRFLNSASPLGIQSVKKLQLVHSTYGEPFLTDMCQWKIRHDNKWMRLCQRLSQEMGSLENLSVDLRICDWPTQLEMTARWARPLLVLKGNGLERVDVVLRHSGFSEQRLTAAARKMEMAMLTNTGLEKRKLEEALERKRILDEALAKRKEIPKALKSLRITYPTVNKISTKPSQKRTDQVQDKPTIMWNDKLTSKPKTPTKSAKYLLGYSRLGD